MKKLLWFLLIPATLFAQPSQFAGLMTNATDLTCGGTAYPACSTWPMPANPGMGGSYFDPTWGTTTWELPVGSANTYGHVVSTYARVQAFSSDNKYLFMTEGGNTNAYAWLDLYDATTTPPTFINRITTSDGTAINAYNGDANWAFTVPTRIYYVPWTGAHGLELRYVDVTGCTTSSCSLTPTLVHTFSCTSDSYFPNGAGVAGNLIETGSGGQGGMFDSTDTYFSFSCDYYNGDRGEIDLIKYNRSTDTVTTQEKWYQVCTGNVPSGCYVWAHSQNGTPGWNMYRFNQHPDYHYVTMGWQCATLTNADWQVGCGVGGYGPSWNFLGPISVGDWHSDAGFDINGVPVWVGYTTALGTDADWYSLEVTNLATLSTSGITSKQLQLPCTYAYVGTPCPTAPFLGSKVNGSHISMTGTWGSVPGYALFSTMTMAGKNGGYSVDFPLATTLGTAVASAGTATVSPASMSTIGAGTQQTVDWVSTYVYSPTNLGSGVQTATPYDMIGITVGQTLTVGSQTVTVSSITSSTFTATFGSSQTCPCYTFSPNSETITVSSVTPTTFTATFAHPHAANAAVANLTVGDTGPYAMENIAVKIDTTAASGSTATVYRLGRAMSIRDTDYNAEPHTFVNRDWTAYVWNSNWNVDGGQDNGYYTKLSGAAPSFTLTVSTTGGTGTGTINITNNCNSGSQPSGTLIGPCAATPNAGSVFAGWTGTLGCTGIGTCTAYLSANSTMNAVFNLAPTGPLGVMQGIGSIQGTAVLQ